MKTVHCILQSKGGAGKSLLTWLLAQKHKDNASTVFIDLDNSTSTSSRRLGSIVGVDRIKTFHILDREKRLDREKILELFEGIAQSKKFSTTIIDFGAPESEEFLKLLTHHLEASLIKEELKALGVELHLQIVLAGRDAFPPTMDYYLNLKKANDNSFPVYALINSGTFQDEDAAQQTKQTLLAAQSSAFTFGQIGTSQSGQDILGLLSGNGDVSTLGLVGRIQYKKIMREINELPL